MSDGPIEALTSFGVIITEGRVMDIPADERPVLMCMVVRCEWHRGDNPSMLMNHPHSFADVNFDEVTLATYRELGYRFLALDVDHEIKWKSWRANHPEAA